MFGPRNLWSREPTTRCSCRRRKSHHSFTRRPVGCGRQHRRQSDAGGLNHHTAPVPGLAHSAIPAFPDVDQYQSRQLLANLVSHGRLSEAEYEKLGDARGISHQQRNYFWYRKTFQRAASDRSGFAQGEQGAVRHGGLSERRRVFATCPLRFTAAWFDVTRAIHWNAANELIIRIGAHPGVLPANISQGTDFEKNRWTPGIYDDVTLMVIDNPVIATVQVAPQIASASNPVSGILVQTELHNYSDRAADSFMSPQQVFEWKSRTTASEKIETEVEVPADGEKNSDANCSGAQGASVDSRRSVPLPGGDRHGG